MRPTVWSIAAASAAIIAVLLATGGSQAESQPAVLVNDQNTSGGMLIVDAARLPEGGFVAIHGVTTEGQPGAFWGVSGSLGAGYHAEVPVPIDRNVTEPTEVSAVLYKDGNGNHVFEGTGSSPKDPRYERSGRSVFDTATVTPTSFAGSSSELSTRALLGVGALSAGAGYAAWATWFRER